MARRYVAALATWKILNDFLRGAGEESCKKLLATELAGAKRRMYLLRIHARFNKLRGLRERAELKEKSCET